jgi:hypothetical protein
MADDDADKQALDALWEEHRAGRINTYEYNQRRRAIREAARAKAAAAAAAAAPQDAAAPAAAPPPAAGLHVVPPAPAAVPTTPEPAPPADASAPAAQAPAGEAAPSGGFGWTDRSPKSWGSGGRGDDPAVRVVHPPTGSGVGNGKSFLFIFGLRIARDTDQMMVRRETEQLQDDIAVLCSQGFTVVYDPQGGKKDFLDALYGQGEGVEGLVPAGIYWSAHGHDDGRIECCDGQLVAHTEVETAKVSPGLRLMVFGACYTGSFAKRWREALGGHPLVVGWGRPVTIDRAVEFLQSNPDTDTDFDDLVTRYILADTPIPPLPEQGTQPAASVQGRKEELAGRVGPISELLGSAWREQDTHYEMMIHLPGNRRHVVRLFAMLGTNEYLEGRPLVGIESEVGELSRIVEPEVLFSVTGVPSFARVSLVQGKNDMPDIVVQGFLTHANATNTDVAALAYQVARAADELEFKIFGSDRNY